MFKKFFFGILIIGLYNFINVIDKKICKNYFYSNFCFSIYKDVVKIIYDEDECYKLDRIENECWIIGENIYFDKNLYLNELYLKYWFIIPHLIIFILFIFLLKKLKMFKII